MTFPTHPTILHLFYQQQPKAVSLHRHAVAATIIRHSFRSYFAQGPSPTTKTWERTAARVKDTETSHNHNNPYLHRIRETHDPSLHIKTIEEELQSSIGKALGKQGQKILMFTHLMNQEYQRYETLLQQIMHEEESMDQRIKQQRELLLQTAQAYNQHRTHALQARWELMVHRQAAGFLVNNHQHVMEHYPIAEALPTEYKDDKEDETTVVVRQQEKEESKQQFGDQLDWWQRVGRWK